MARPLGQWYNPLSSLADEDNEEQEQFQDEPLSDTVAPPSSSSSSSSSRGAGRQRDYDRIADTDDNSFEDAPAPPKADEDAGGGLDQKKEEEDDDEHMITVVVLDSAQTKFNVRANPDWTIGRFKKVGATVHKIPPISQRLIYRGKLLADSITLRDSGIIQDQVILHLFPKPRVVVTNSSSATQESSAAAAPTESGGAHVPQIILDEEEAERRGQILVLGSVEIAEAQNNVKLLSLLLLVVCSMRLLALFSIAMGVADDDATSYQDDLVPSPDNGGSNSTDGGGGYSPPQGSEYQTRPWENTDYFDLIVSSIGFYVATLGMKATTENTLRLANDYLIGTFIAGVCWNVWNVFLYLIFVKDETTDKPDDDQTVALDRDDFVTVAFFTVVLPLLVWFLCCLRAHQFRQLLEEAEQEAAERIRYQLTVDNGGVEEETNGNANARELTEISSLPSSTRSSNRTMIV
jgi:hypothetical protein